MALNAIVTDINTVPEALRTEYTEKDGKFYLQVTEVDGHKLENVTGLQNALVAERNLKNQLEKSLGNFKDIDPALARTAIAAVAALGDITPDAAKAAFTELEDLRKQPKGKTDKDVQAQLDAQKTSLETLFGTEKTALEGQLGGLKAANEGLTNQLKTLLVDNQIKAVIGSMKLVDGLQGAAEMLLNRSVRIVEKDGKLEVAVVDGNGEPRVKVEGSSIVPFTVADLADELKKTTPGLFQAEDKGGVGIAPGRTAPAGAGGQSNPWTKEAWNMTEQAKLRISNPALAAQMKAAAGIK